MRLAKFLKTFLILLALSVFFEGCKDDDPVFQEVSVNFGSDLIQIQTGETIQFEDLSTGEPNDWTWTFENGTPSVSTEQNPNITFNSPGLWSVKLVAKNQEYADSLTKEEYIIVLPSENLVAHFPFNNSTEEITEADFTAIEEFFSNSPNRFGDVDQAISFDGIDDFITYEHNELLNFTKDEDFTVAIWVNASEQINLESTYNSIVSKWLAASFYSYPFTIRWWNSTADPLYAESFYARQWYAYCDQNELNRLYSDIVPHDAWHFVVMVKEGNTVKLFVDNVFQSENTSPYAGNDLCDTQSDAPLFIGKRFDNLRYFRGMVDELRFYSTALDENAIHALYVEDNIFQE